MAFEYGFFWDSNNGDRKYNAASFEQWLKKFFTSGVFTGDLQVTANGDMTVNVSDGYANVSGKVRFFDTSTTLSIATADSSLNRIDTVVIERNNTNRSVDLKLVTGTPSASPVAPAPVRGGNVHQLVLAQITVPAGAVKIAQTNIKDTREDLHLCGLVTGTVKEMDVEHLRRQFDAICDECEVEFETWFEGIKNQLSTDAAGNLQNQIDVEKARINELVAQKSDEITEEMYLNFSGAMTTCSTIKIASNGMNGVLRIYNLKWTSNQISMYDTIAVFPEELIPLAFNDGQQNVLYEADDIKLIIQGTSLRVFRKTTGTPMSHNIMLTYALKNPVMTELSDIRIDVSGERHPSAGDAIRAQINDIREEMLNIDNYAYKDYAMVCDGSEPCTLVVGEDVQVGDTIRLTKKGDVSIWYTRTDGATGMEYPPADGSIKTFEVDVNSMAVVYNITGCEVSIPKKMYVADLKAEMDRRFAELEARLVQLSV